MEKTQSPDKEKQRKSTFFLDIEKKCIFAANMNERHRKKRLTAWRYLLALPRSVIVNLRLLPWRQAWHLPLLVSHRTVIDNLSGRVELNCDNLRIGLVKIGFGTYQGTDFRRDRTHLNLRGTLTIKGECTFGAGCSVEVAEGARLIVGPQFNFGPRSLLICHKAMTFGANGLISWCCTLMDTDQHPLIDAEGRRVNPDREIHFGDNVWMGCHVIVSKGTSLPDETTVSAGARLSGRYEETQTVLAGNPAIVVRRGIKREL